MKKIFLLALVILFAAGYGYAQTKQASVKYYDEQRAETAQDKAVTRISIIPKSDGSYAIEKYDLKNKRMEAVETYDKSSGAIGTWEIYDADQKKTRKINFDVANKYLAGQKQEVKPNDDPPTIDPGFGQSGSSSANEATLSDPALKKSKYKTLREYFSSEFYVSEEINNYLNDVQGINIRATFTIDSLGKVSDLSFRPKPSRQVLSELVRVLLNAPELLPTQDGGKAITRKVTFTIKMQVQ